MTLSPGGSLLVSFPNLCVRCKLYIRLPDNRQPPGKDRMINMLTMNLSEPMSNDLPFRDNLLRAAGGFSICGQFISAVPSVNVAGSSTDNHDTAPQGSDKQVSQQSSDEQVSKDQQDGTGPGDAPHPPLARKSCVPGTITLLMVMFIAGPPPSPSAPIVPPARKSCVP